MGLLGALRVKVGVHGLGELGAVGAGVRPRQAYAGIRRPRQVYNSV